MLKHSSPLLKNIYLKDRQGGFPSACSPPKCLQQLRLGQAKSRNQELNLGLHVGGRDPTMGLIIPASQGVH